MKLRDRLLIAWLTPLVPFLLIGMVTAYGLWSMTRSVDEVRSVQVQRIHLVTQAIEAFREEHALLTRWAETGDEEYREEARQRSSFVRARLPTLEGPDRGGQLQALLDDYEVGAGLIQGPPGTSEERDASARELVRALQDRHAELRVALRDELSSIGLRGRSIAAAIWVVVTVILVVGGTTSYLVARDLTGAARELERGTAALAAGDFDYRIALVREDELGDLAQAFDRMAARIALLDRMKVDFFANVSHDLKTPLTSMTEAVDLLEEEIAGPLTDNQKRLVQVLKSDVRRLRALVTNVLDLSRMDADQVELSPGHLPGIVKRIVQDNALVAERRGLSLQTRVQPELPPVVIHQPMVEQVLTNLVSNAFKFSPPQGTVRIDAHLAPPGTHAAGRAVEVIVHDAGPGIPPNARERVFDRFYQVPGEQRKGGTGLGLYICKRIVVAHGGTIRADESELGGTKIAFTLPVVDSAG